MCVLVLHPPTVELPSSEEGKVLKPQMLHGPTKVTKAQEMPLGSKCLRLALDGIHLYTGRKYNIFALHKTHLEPVATSGEGLDRPSFTIQGHSHGM